jgi:hypothetical protein
MNIPYLSPHTRTELENALSWMENELITETHNTEPHKDTWEQQAFGEGYMRAVYKMQKLIYDAGKKDFNDISLALLKHQEELENELE